MGGKYGSKLLSSLRSNQIHETVSVEDKRETQTENERSSKYTVIQPYIVPTRVFISAFLCCREQKSWAGDLGMRLLGMYIHCLDSVVPFDTQIMQTVHKHVYYPVDISTTVFSYSRAVQYHTILHG